MDVWEGATLSAKEYLSQAFTLQKLIKAKMSRIQDLRDIQQWVGINYSKPKVQASPKPDPMGDATANLLDLVAECQMDICRLLGLQREIVSLIESVDHPVYRLILYERYVNLKCWEDIAVDNNYSTQHILRLHGKALQNVDVQKTKEESK